MSTSAARSGWRKEKLQVGTGSTRRVDWPLIVGGVLRLPLSQVPSSSASSPNAFAVLRASDELERHRDETTLLRRAVEPARAELGLERTAIFLSGRSLDLLQGTWGTGLNGQTTDERDIAFLMGSAHREAIARRRRGAQPGRQARSSPKSWPCSNRMLA
ncbi:MAG: hypothetical protein ABI895_08365 [Deltaproteobacteria bacterium]